MCVRERDRETERQRQRQRETETETETDRETETETETETEREREDPWHSSHSATQRLAQLHELNNFCRLAQTASNFE